MSRHDRTRRGLFYPAGLRNASYVRLKGVGEGRGRLLGSWAKGVGLEARISGEFMERD